MQSSRPPSHRNTDVPPPFDSTSRITTTRDVMQAPLHVLLCRTLSHQPHCLSVLTPSVCPSIFCLSVGSDRLLPYVSLPVFQTACIYISFCLPALLSVLIRVLRGALDEENRLVFDQHKLPTHDHGTQRLRGRKV